MRRFLLYLTSIAVLFYSHFYCLAKDTAEEIAEREEAIRRSIFIASSGQERILKIGLVDCIAFALKNNSEVKIKKIEPLLFQQDISVAKSVFEPSLNLEAELADTKEQSSSSTLFSPRVSKSHTDKLNLGLTGKLPLGTEYDVSFDNKKYKSNASYQVINPYNKD